MEDNELLVSGGGTIFDGDIVSGYQADLASRYDGTADIWYFQGAANDSVSSLLVMDSDIEEPMNVVSVKLELDNQDGTTQLLTEDWINGNSDRLELRISNYQLPTDGRYRLAVLFGSNQGHVLGEEAFSYTVTLLGSGGQRPEIPCQTPISTIDLTDVPFEGLGVSTDTPILNNEPSIQGGIDDEILINYYVFAAQEDDLVTITMNRISDDLIPLLGIQDINGELLDRETADLSGRRAVMNFLVPETGWYTLIATREDVDEGITSGNYQLQFEGSSIVGESATAPDVGVAATVIRSGQIVEGIINDEDVTFYYLISLERDEEITLTMRRTTGDLEPFVAIMDTDLSVLERGQPDLAGRTSTLSFTASASGWYVIASTREDADVGTSSGGFAMQID